MAKTLRLDAFLVMLLVLVVSTLLTPPQAAAFAPPAARTTKPGLCGRLVFLQDFRTQAKLIGLLPCGAGRPYLFKARPAELHPYYRIEDAVLAKGAEVWSLEYGRLDTYIVRFSAYTPIQDCNACTPRAPTATPRPEQAALTCAELLLESAAAQFEELASVRPTLTTDLSDYARQLRTSLACDDNPSCAAEHILQRLGEGLGAHLERRAARREALILFLWQAVEDSDGQPTCTNLPWNVFSLLRGLNTYGFAIDAFAITSPATHLAVDRLGRRAGFLENGVIVEEIPSSKVALTSRNKLILLPGGEVTSLTVRAVASGPITLTALYNQREGIVYASFTSLPLAAGSLGVLDLASSPPTLDLEPPSGRTAEPRPANTVVPFMATVVWLPSPTPPPSPTLTPTLSATPTATLTPAPSATPSPTPSATPPLPWAQSPLACPSGWILGVGVVVLLLWRRRIHPPSHR